MNKQALQKMIDDKLVLVQKHPEADLFIYNYSPRVQYERLWNDITLRTRGLILDAEMNVVARPFGKFFNFEEHSHDELPMLPFEVFDKLDGSLGILYWLNDKPYIATRGSFISEQSQHATNVLHTKYAHTFDKIDRTKTYLFEIIYPSNRIVVDYGTTDDIILLTVIDNHTGIESLDDIGFTKVIRYNVTNDIESLRRLEESNKEGFVIRFSNGFRVKMKFKEYVRLHRIITGISNVIVWEYLSEGKSFDELLDRVPDEFYAWVKKTQNELCEKFTEIKRESFAAFTELATRKETAMYFQTQKYPSILFSVLDGKSPDKIIWKMLKPKYSKPFKIEE